jgi:hypothetical protein
VCVCGVYYVFIIIGGLYCCVAVSICVCVCAVLCFARVERVFRARAAVLQVYLLCCTVCCVKCSPTPTHSFLRKPMHDGCTPLIGTSILLLHRGASLVFDLFKKVCLKMCVARSGAVILVPSLDGRTRCLAPCWY